MARLDRLATARDVAQTGAVLGREFSYELLRAVSPVEEPSLQQALAKLVDAGVLYQRGLPPQARYIFKHALIQDAAYQSLLKSRRLQYHQQIAQVLEERFTEAKETQPELLAHHYTEAGLAEQAIPYWQRAGQRATQHSAYMEAISHLTRGLELLRTLPETLGRVQQELALQGALGPALMITKGHGAPEVEQVYIRARELCQQLGETPQLFSVLCGLSVVYSLRAELRTARELGERILTLAQHAQNPSLLLEAHHTLWMSLFYLGELTTARVHLEQGVTLYDPHQPPFTGFLYLGDDPGVCCRVYTARALWHLGYPNQAVKAAHEALALAQELSQPFSLAYALDFTAVVHQLRREGQAAQERAEAVLTLAAEQGFSHWLAWGTILRGWALAEQGQGEEGIAQMRQGLAATRTAGQELGRPWVLALLAEAYGKVGQVEEGLRVLAEALAVSDSTGERVYEAELYRLMGELTLQKLSVISSQLSVPNTRHLTPNTQEAEACFLKAIEIARKQQAKSLELRAVASLARLWQQQGKRLEAHTLLAEIYGWFTEGFDTKDLQEAKTLLDSLVSSV